MGVLFCLIWFLGVPFGAPFGSGVLLWGPFLALVFKNGRRSPKERGGGLERTEKNNVSKNVHPSRAPGPFWQNRDAVRTLITTVGCVFRCGRKSGHGSPQEEPVGFPGGARRGPRTPKGALITPETMFFGTCHRNTHLENVHPSLAPGPFWPNRDADRSLITTVGCIFRCGPKNGRGGPKGRASIFKQKRNTTFLKMCTPLEHQAHFGQRAVGFDANHLKGQGR